MRPQIWQQTLLPNFLFDVAGGVAIRPGQDHGESGERCENASNHDDGFDRHDELRCKLEIWPVRPLATLIHVKRRADLLSRF